MGKIELYPSRTDDKAREKCGVFLSYGDNNAADIVLQGLKSLQHRGQDSAGIAGYDHSYPDRVVGLGKVKEVFPDDNIALRADRAIGQVRYSTSRGLAAEYAQPIGVDIGNGNMFYLGHNGNIATTRRLEGLMDSLGVPYDHLNDSGMVAHSIGYFLRKGASLEDSFAEVVPYMRGVYSLVMVTPTQMGAARCEYGVKPQSIGKIGDSYITASETCAIDAVGADYIRDIIPGELVTFDSNGMTAHQISEPKYALCAFEPIYFASPDSFLYGKRVRDYRIDLGRQLAIEFPNLQADLVVPLLKSGELSGKGFTEKSGIPTDEEALKINENIDRTFITANMDERWAKAEAKYIANPDIIRGKRVVTIDDSQVHGTTDRVTVPMLRRAGAASVIVLKASPIYRYPNFYGTNTSVQSDLASYRRSEEQIREWIGADQVGFLSLEGLKSVFGENRERFDYCVFDGEYKVPIGEHISEVEGLKVPAGV